MPQKSSDKSELSIKKVVISIWLASQSEIAPHANQNQRWTA